MSSNRANYINHAASVTENCTATSIDGKQTFQVPKGAQCNLIELDGNNFILTRETTGVAFRMPRNKVNVLQARQWTNERTAGLMMRLRQDCKAKDGDGSSIQLTTAHWFRIQRLSSDSEEFIVDIPFAPDEGKKGIRVHIKHAIILWKFPKPTTHLHQRVKFSSDCVGTDSSNGTFHFKKGHQKSCVRSVTQGGRNLLVSTPEAGNRLLSVPYSSADPIGISEHDLANHTFRALSDQACLNQPKDILKKGVVGVITKCKLDKNKVLLRALDGSEYWVPLYCFEVGVLHGKYSVIYGTPKYGTPQAQFQLVKSNDIIDEVVAGILKGIYAERASLPPEAKLLEGLYATEAAQKAQAAAFKAGLHETTARCMRQKSCVGSIDDLKSLPDATNSTRRGIYVRIYEGFAKTSRYKGKSYIYVGMTKSFKARGEGHRKSAHSKKTTSRHYAIMREAQSIYYRVIWTQAAERSDDKKQLGLMESLFTMLLSSMDPRVLTTVDTARDAAKSGGFNYWSNSQVAAVLQHVTDVAFRNLHFLRPNSNVPLEGLNVRIPLLFDVSSSHEGRRWIRQTLNDRLAFSFGAATFKPITGTKGDHRHKFELFENDAVTVSVPQAPAHGLVSGTKFWMFWKVMTDGHHHAPYFRIPRIGFLNNWEAGNRMGLRIVWQDPKTSKYYSRYEQAGSNNWNVNFTHDAGSLITHVHGASMFAYLTRSQWGQNAGERPPFYPSIRTPDMLDLRVNHFRQEFTVEIVLSPSRVLPAVERDMGVAGQKMQKLGLDNVNGGWRSFNPVNQDSDPGLQQLKKQGPVSSSVVKKFVTGREDCDFCFHSFQFSGYTAKCERARDSTGNLTNRCQACVRRGLPCSWSFVNKLFGDPWTDQYERMRVVLSAKTRFQAAKGEIGRSKYTRRFEEIEDALCMRVPNLAAQQPREIQNPLIHTLVEDKFDIEAEIEEEAKLDD